jgi:hypothetical protein
MEISQNFCDSVGFWFCNFDLELTAHLLTNHSRADLIWPVDPCNASANFFLFILLVNNRNFTGEDYKEEEKFPYLEAVCHCSSCRSSVFWVDKSVVKFHSLYTVHVQTAHFWGTQVLDHSHFICSSPSALHLS